MIIGFQIGKLYREGGGVESEKTGLTYNLRHFDISSAAGGGGFFLPDPENKVTVNRLI